MTTNNEIKSQLFHMLEQNDCSREIEILKISDFSLVQSDDKRQSSWEVWYDIHLVIPPSIYSTIINDLQILETNILKCIRLIYRSERNVVFSKAYILPKNVIELTESQKKEIDLPSVIQLLESIKSIMIAVSTGGPRIQEKNPEYIKKQSEVSEKLKRIGLDNPNHFSDLWEWYGYWNPNLTSYQERRDYIGKIFDPFTRSLRNNVTLPQSPVVSEIEITGWERIDRTSASIKTTYLNASNEEEFQTIGLLCRETLISLATEIYNEDLHLCYCDTQPSTTDAKRRIDAYIQHNLSGSINANIRKFAKVSNDLANEVTHKRTATKKDAGLCITATISLINIIRILENKGNFA